MKVEMGNIKIKNSEGKSLTLTYEEVRSLKYKLNEIFPSYAGHYYPRPYVWWGYNNTAKLGPGDNDYGRLIPPKPGDISYSGDTTIDLKS